MAEHSGERDETPYASPENGNESGGEAGSEAYDGLSMAPELMLDLARKAAELVVARIEGLPKENAWEGDFQQILSDQLMEDPPEDGRQRKSLNGPHARSCQSHCGSITPVTSRLSRRHPRGPGCWPTSWPPGTTST